MNAEWTEQDILRFRALVRSQGGDIQLPVHITRDGGVVVSITPPPNAPAGWAQQALVEFDRNRK